MIHIVPFRSGLIVIPSCPTSTDVSRSYASQHNLQSNVMGHTLF